LVQSSIYFAKVPEGAFPKSDYAVSVSDSFSRRQIIDQTIGLLSRLPAEAVTPENVSFSCGMDLTTFLGHFRSITDVVLVKLGELKDVRPACIELLGEVCSANDPVHHVTRFVRTYAKQWDVNRAALRYRNRMSELGDARFELARVQMMRPLVERWAQVLSTKWMADPMGSEGAAEAVLGLVDSVAADASYSCRDRPTHAPYADGRLVIVAHMITGLLKPLGSMAADPHAISPNLLH
jgi:hypothetical protein